MRIERPFRLRQCGATDIPLSFEDPIFIFDLIDCVCEIEYSADLFSTFPRAKVMHDGVLVDGLTIPFRMLRQTEYRPFKMIW